MKIKSSGENQIIINLSKDDLIALEITYDEMDYENIETRRVIWTLLDEARRELDYDIDPSGKIFIEAFPNELDGCELRFTVIPNSKKQAKKIILKKGMKPLIYEFNDSGNLIDAARAIVKNNLCGFKSELYSLNNIFYLIVYPQKVKAITILSEYGKILSHKEINASIIREHHHKICSQEAIESLAV